MIDEVIGSLAALHPLSPDSARAYERSMERLESQVNEELEANPDVAALIGGNSLDLMRNNHRNHAAFMATVFKIGSYELLARTIPWVYRTYRARGFSFDYFPVELAAWKRAVSACLDNAPAREINAVYDWMIGQHEKMISLSTSGEGIAFSLPGETTEMQEVLLSLMLHGDSRGSLQLVNTSVRTVDDLKHFYLDVICPVMYRIGLLWERNDISVAEEHVATAVVGRITAGLYSRFANLDVYRGKAVVTSGPNEFHEVGARMMADFLEMNGRDVIYLGANSPGEHLVSVLRQHRPFMAGLSVATLFSLSPARRAIELIKADRDTRGVKVMVGGLAFHDMPRLSGEIGADGYAPDAEKGALLANAWWDGRNR